MTIAFLLTVLFATKSTDASAAEHRIYEYLMDGYNPLERPVSDVSKPVKVFLEIVLQQLIDVDEVEQRITLNVWLKYVWQDYKLIWNISEFDNIKDVRFPSTKLWRPDVLLYNSVDSSFDSTYPTNIVVYHDGTINWIPPGIFVISCKIDITWFPFDEQKCYFKFGSWTFDGTKIDLQPGENGFDMSEYLVNGEWSIEHTEVIRSELFYACCPEPYPDLKFWLRMKRRTLYFGLNLIVPCIVITLMCILGFALPPDAGEKITLQITVLLAVCVFLNMVTNMSPPTSEAVPLLGTFFSTCMVVVGAAVLTTVMVLNFHHTSPEFTEMGYTTRCLLLYWLPWLLFMSRPGMPIKRRDLPNPFRRCGGNEHQQQSHQRRTSQPSEQNSELDDRLNLLPTELAESKCDDASIDERINTCYKQLAEQQHELSLDTALQSQLLMIHRIYNELKKVTNRMRDEDEQTEKQNEWIFAAMVIDRFCLWLLSLFIVGSTCYIMFTAPYLTVDMNP